MDRNLKDSSYRLVLIPDDSSNMNEAEFDKIDNISVNTASTITSHPIVNGDIIADHMYRNPVTMSVSGTFSLNGNRPTDFSGKTSNRLTNIEQYFEKLKDEGIFCRLVTRNRNDESNEQFMARNNMVLTSIRWNEKQNSIDFDFTFTEAMTVNTIDIVSATDVTDPNLPALTDASTLDFTDTLLDWSKVDAQVLKTLFDVNLLEEGFFNYAVAKANEYLSDAAYIGAGIAVGATVGLLAGKVGASVLASIAVSMGASGPVGWLALAGGIAIGAVVGCIIAIIKHFKKKAYKIKQFRLYQSDRQNQQEYDRFTNYLGNIHLQLESLEDILQAYGISSNENQECMLYIDDNYYVFNFTKNNATGRYGLSIQNVYDNYRTIYSAGQIAGLSNIAECTHDNCLFYTSSGHFWVYLMNLKLEDAKARNASQEEIDSLSNDLTNYAIFVSQIDMKDFNSVLSDLIENAMRA